MIEVTVRLFGAFRAQGDRIAITVPAPATVRILRLALQEKLGALVADSALADDEKILGEDHVITSGVTIALLPPVCGG